MRAALNNAAEPWLRLALAPAIGPILAHRLLDAFGDAAAVFAAPRAEIEEIPGIKAVRLAALFDPEIAAAAKREVERAAELGVELVALDDPRYPELLGRLPYAPLVLWMRGRLAAEDRLAIAMVGPRTPSSYARLMTESIAPALAGQGIALVSGLAHGIDAAVHRCALDAKGRTIAVLGQGLAAPLYPADNAGLAERILAEDRGALVSIFPLETQPHPSLFPQRNEIVAGLSLGTLVVEAALTSGGLITARHAAAQGRTVMACPGDVTRRAARGSNRLIADGAALVETADDALAALGPDLRNTMVELGLRPPEKPAWDEPTAPAALPPDADPLDAALLNLLEEEPLAIDLVLDRLAKEGHPAPRVQQRLLLLELDGKVRQMPGRIYARARGGHR